MLVVHSRQGRNRSASHMRKKFYADLERLGFRRRTSPTLPWLHSW